MRKFIVLLFIVVSSVYGCSLISAGSFPYAEEGAYYFDDFLATSGNSTIRLYFEDGELIEATRDALGRLGCESEAFLARKMVAVNVPKLINYRTIKKYLDDGESQSKWQYEESCLSHKLHPLSK